MKREPKVTTTDLWSAIEDARRACGLDVTDRPANSITVAEYAARYSLTTHTANRQLHKLVALGRMVVGHAMIPASDGRMLQTCIYTPVMP